MKLWIVEISTVAVIAAETEREAVRIAELECADILGDDPNPRIRVMKEAKTASDLSNGWTPNCLPYGADTNDTIADLLTPNAAVTRRHTTEIGDD